MTTLRKNGIARAAFLAAVALFAIVALRGPFPSPAAAQNEPWRALLSLQLRDSFNCQLAEILYHRDVPVGANVGLEGRVRCIDQREYDFSRRSEHAKFEIRLCQPAVC